MKALKIFITIMVLIGFVCSPSFSSDESDANTSGISVVASDNSVSIHWNKWATMKYYEFTVEDIYGTYSQRFTLFENYKTIGLSEGGVYKITLEGFDGASSVPYDMGYYYFPFGFGTAVIDPQVLAKAISDNLDIKPQEIESKIYRFRVVWNDSWWCGISVANSSDEAINALMTISSTDTNAKLTATITIQSNGIIKGTAAYFLGLVNIDPESEESKKDNYIISFEVPPTGDVEMYTAQLVEGKLANLAKDSSVDDYIYKGTED